MDAGADIAIGLGTKVISVITSVMPATISDFYVVINGVTRRTGSPPVNIAVNTPASLKMYVVTQSSGGLNFTVAGIGELFLFVLEHKLPPLKNYLENLRTHHNPLYDLFATRMFSLVDSTWQLLAGSPAPAEWKLTKGLNFPQHKFDPTDVNHSDVVDIEILSPQLITKGVDANKALYLKGLHKGDNAGYRAYMTTRSLSSLLPSLADLADKKQSVKGTVNVQSGSIAVGVN